MTNRTRSVTVHVVPSHVTASAERRFLHELQTHVNTERPRLVLDCSKVQAMDEPTVHLLLCCLEEGMKRNGDVKLAALSESSEGILRKAGLDRLFEIYPTQAAALKSFHSYVNSEVFAPVSAAGRAASSESAA
jgi:anti-sigma B factor antagonist